MADLCPHGDITAACVDCLTGRPPERPNPPPARPEVVSRPFPARFPSQCPACNLGIHEGQLIVRMSNDIHQHQKCEAP